MPASPLYNEKELLLQIANGDEKAFTRLFHHYRNKIFTVALKLTESDVLAEEIVQDVFLKIWIKRNTLQEINNFDSFLFIIARNHTFTALKKLARKGMKIEDADLAFLTELETPEDPLLEKEYRKILAQSIDRLPPQQKQVYQLRNERGLTRDEIAAILNISPSTAKAHLRSALRSIRAYCVARLFIDVIIIMMLMLSFY